MDEHEIVDLLAEFLLHPYLFVAYFWPNLLIGEDTVVSIEEIAVIIVPDEKKSIHGEWSVFFLFLNELKHQQLLASQKSIGKSEINK